MASVVRAVAATSTMPSMPNMRKLSRPNMPRMPRVLKRSASTTTSQIDMVASAVGAVAEMAASGGGTSAGVVPARLGGTSDGTVPSPPDRPHEEQSPANPTNAPVRRYRRLAKVPRLPRVLKRSASTNTSQIDLSATMCSPVEVVSDGGPAGGEKDEQPDSPPGNRPNAVGRYRRLANKVPRMPRVLKRSASTNTSQIDMSANIRDAMEAASGEAASGGGRAGGEAASSPPLPAEVSATKKPAGRYLRRLRKVPRAREMPRAILNRISASRYAASAGSQPQAPAHLHRHASADSLYELSMMSSMSGRDVDVPAASAAAAGEGGAFPPGGWLHARSRSESSIYNEPTSFYELSALSMSTRRPPIEPAASAGGKRAIGSRCASPSRPRSQPRPQPKAPKPW